MSYTPSALLSIIAQSRAGARRQAWRLFREAGLDEVSDDPAVLSVKGRLLKEEAGCSSGVEQRRLYKQSGKAYARAAALSGRTYPLINAATLSLLGGENGTAQQLASAVLDGKGDEAETPYWREATRAEALLLLGKTTDSRQSLLQAMRNAPRAFEDHAATLRQFGLILDKLKQDKAWLDDFRPPRSLHFAGTLSLTGAEEKLIASRIRSLIADERVAAGFGALAAGADILIAEMLLEAGAELHLVLPSPVPEFRENSVAKYGRRWNVRFDRVLERATTCRMIEVPFPFAIRFAAEIAMGLAEMRAKTLQTEAIQIAVLGKNASAKGDPSASAWMASHWKQSGRRTCLLRVQSSNRRGTLLRASTQQCLCAIIRIEFPQAGPVEAAHLSALAAARLRVARRALLVPPRWTGDAMVLGFATPKAAADAVVGILRMAKLREASRIVGDYGGAYRLPDPFSGKCYFAGMTPLVAEEIIASTPLGAFHASENFVAALNAAGTEHRTEYVGDFHQPGAGQLPLFSMG